MVVTILALGLIWSGFAYADDTPKSPVFNLAKFVHFSASCFDYQTTFHCSHYQKFSELNPITKLYWRSPPAFCAFKSVEMIAQNWLFDTIYKWSKPAAYITVVLFAIVRIVAFRNNVRVMGVR